MNINDQTVVYVRISSSWQSPEFSFRIPILCNSSLCCSLHSTEYKCDCPERAVRAYCAAVPRNGVPRLLWGS